MPEPEYYIEILYTYLSLSQVLEQEKYQLRGKFELLEEEYQQQMVELLGDMNYIKRSIKEQAQRRKNFERQSSNTIQQLTEENQRLSAHVKRLGEREKHLVSHRQAINTEIFRKKTNMQEHFINMENLNKRISQILLEKVKLEKQI